MKILVALLVLISIPSVLLAASDEGTIKTLYTDTAGNLAVQLGSGFPNSVAANECSTYNGWAGVSTTVNSALKAALLSAEASQSPVLLSISGCEAGGAWLKITAVYVK